MALKRRKILKQMLDLGHGTQTIPADSGGTLTGDLIGLHTFIDVLNVKDFGAEADGNTDDTVAINAALTEAASTGAAVLLTKGTYALDSTVVVPSNVLFYGFGRLSKLVSRGSNEAVRLDGHYAAIARMWITGSGQVANAVDGRRGIWIGESDHLTASNFCRIEDCIIDQHTGNGISGIYNYAVIHKNFVIDNTDANIFVPVNCAFNSITANHCHRSRYAGIDVNGNDNEVIGNFCFTNGGGTLDPPAWDGILVAQVSDTYPAVMNIIKGNRVKDNLCSGIAIVGSTGSLTVSAYGNLVQGNIASGHTNLTGGVHLPSGIAVWGGDDTVVDGNLCYANRDNYLIASGGSIQAVGIQVMNNKSKSATRHGYFVPNSPRIDLVGDLHANQLTIKNNWDRAAGGDSFKFQPVATAFEQFTIVGNRSMAPAGYAFNNTDATLLYDYEFKNNFASGTGSGFQTGFDPRQFTPSDATPSVLNGNFFQTNNASGTTITMFDDGVSGQEITVLIADANTIIDFTGTNLKGNNGVDFKASNGDWVVARFNGTNWYCVVQHITGYGQGASSSITQQTNKGTAVTLNFISGAITMNNASLSADAEVTFTLNNSLLGTSDQIDIKVIGGPNYGSYLVSAVVTGTGTATISVRNVSTGALTDAVVLGFFIFKQ